MPLQSPNISAQLGQGKPPRAAAPDEQAAATLAKLTVDLEKLISERNTHTDIDDARAKALAELDERISIIQNDIDNCINTIKVHAPTTVPWGGGPSVPTPQRSLR